MYPSGLRNLIDCLKYLPGIGEKSAERMAFSILNFDRLVESSIPAVSRKVTAPIGNNSHDFSTTSVVVPFVSDTIDTCWLVIAFNSEDFPTFVLPNKEMCNLSDFNAFILFNSNVMINFIKKLLFFNKLRLYERAGGTNDTQKTKNIFSIN